MKTFRNYFLLTALVFTLNVAGAQSGIVFEHGTWSEVLAKAEKEDKLVFVDAYTDWCGPCKWMAANTFTDDAVADYFNARFINAKIDMEKGEGPGLADEYRVQAYPSLLFVNAEGELYHKAIGAMGPEDFLKLGTSVADGEVGSLAEMTKKFESGAWDRDFLASYIVRMNDARYDYTDALEAFRPGMAGEKLMEDANWKVFGEVFRRTDTDEFQYMMAHRDAFEQKFGEDAVRDKIIANYRNALFQARRNADENQWNRLMEELRATDFDGAEQTALIEEMSWHQGKEDWKAYAKTVLRVMEKYPVDNPNFLNSIAWTFYEHIDNKKQLEHALEWGRQSVKAAESYYNLDTVAMLLHKLGRNKEAKEMAKAAIERAKADGLDYSETEKALNEM